MTDSAIEVTELGKSYHLGNLAASYNTLRDSVVGLVRRDSASRSKEIFWALRHLSFEVPNGEVVGVIGRNGAGKSTLLKLLSRITTPTEGEIKIRGRVGALLEVGTGFHPELSGRENIYLNGSILGMTRSDINRRFDDIVEFAELPTFLELPVKRYSSGMYVRLAFAVAAHLEPDVLLVDEVLAVGDYRFQNKCLGRMGEMSREGRTVIFVSHALNAIQALCSRVLVLEAGQLIRDGSVEDAIGAYTRSSETELESSDLSKVKDRAGEGQARLSRFWASEDRVTSGTIRNGRPAHFHVGYETVSGAHLRDLIVTISVKTALGATVFYHHNLLTLQPIEDVSGSGTATLSIPRLPLRQGIYTVDLQLSQDGGRILQDSITDAGRFEVVDGDFFGTGADYSGGTGAPVMVDGIWSNERHDTQGPAGQDGN
jgi:lipopolysaccharide transport system ATP-binding protein